MNSAPKRHMNTYVHKIINYLRTKKEPVSFLEIKQDLGINLMNNTTLLNGISKNSKIEFKDNKLKYKPTYILNSKDDFINLLINSTSGLEIENLSDCNPAVNQWITELNDRILILKDIDDTKIIFYNDYIVERAPDEIINIFTKIKVPNYTDLIAELLNSTGMNIQRSEVYKKKMPTKPKGKRYQRKVKITNTHVKHLDLS